MEVGLWTPDDLEQFVERVASNLEHGGSILIVLEDGRSKGCYSIGQVQRIIKRWTGIDLTDGFASLPASP